MADASNHSRFLNPWVLHHQKLGLELKCPLCLNLFNRPVLLPVMSANPNAPPHPGVHLGCNIGVPIALLQVKCTTPSEMQIWFSWGTVSVVNMKNNQSMYLLRTRQTEPAPALIKAEVPWSVQRETTLSEKDRVLKTVKG